MKLHFTSKIRIVFLLTLFMASFISMPAMAQEEKPGRVDRTGANPSTPVRKPGQRREGQPQSPMSDPRRWVFIAVTAFLVLGGARKWLAGNRGRKMADRIANGQANLAEISNSAVHGRSVLPDLLSLLQDEAPADRKNAALEALIKLWRADELIAEEEKAILSRAIQVSWKQRRKYPRDFSGQFQITALFRLPLLADKSCNEWLRNHLRFETRVTGTRRATDEQWKPLPADSSQLTMEIESRDFPEDSIHRLMLFIRVKTEGLTSDWSLDLPGQATSFEWDHHLKSMALKAESDEKEAMIMQEALAWELIADADEMQLQNVAISPGFAIHHPPVAMLAIPLPRDIAHEAMLEIEEVSSNIRLKKWVIASRGSVSTAEKQFKQIPLEMMGLIDDSAISRAGKYRARLLLNPKPELGWADPEIRSVWPGRLTSPWVEIEIVRR